MRPTQGQDDWKERLIARAREKVLGLGTTPEENPRQLQDYGRAGTSTATRNNANLEEYYSNSGPDPKRPCYIQQLDTPILIYKKQCKWETSRLFLNFDSRFLAVSYF